MNKEDIIALLEHHGIRPTANRILVVEALGKERHPVSQKDLEYGIMTIDKSVVSRTLGTLLKHGLVHSFPSPMGVELYELCRSTHEGETDDDEHAHFFCTQCGRALCLHDVETPQIPLPEGFVAHHTHFVITGLCARCSSGAKHCALCDH